MQQDKEQKQNFLIENENQKIYRLCSFQLRKAI